MSRLLNMPGPATWPRIGGASAPEARTLCIAAMGRRLVTLTPSMVLRTPAIVNQGTAEPGYNALGCRSMFGGQKESLPAPSLIPEPSLERVVVRDPPGRSMLFRYPRYVGEPVRRASQSGPS